MRRLIPLLLFSLVLSIPALASANTSVSINSLSPASAVSVGTAISFSVAAAGFTNPNFNVSDSFSGGSVANDDINSSGNFSWTPTANDVGTHVLTVSVSDSIGDAAAFAETITVSNGPTISISSLAPGYSVVASTPLTFNVVASGFTNPVYTVGDSSSQSSLSGGDMSSNGYFSWTPQNSDIGNHTIIVTVVDSYGHSASQQLAIIVSSAQLTVMSLTPGVTVASGNAVTFKIVPTGVLNPVFGLTDSSMGSTLSTSDIGYATGVGLNSTSQTIGVVTWVPTASDVGNHHVILTALGTSNTAATDTIDLTVTLGSAGTAVARPSVITSTPLVASSPVASAPALVFMSYLTTGSSGTEVLILQNLLAKLGFFSVTPNGYFGPATLAAVEKFQSAHGLAMVGTVGPQTRALLNASSAGSVSTNNSAYVFTVSLALGSQNATVTALQQRLTSEGDYSGPISGYFGILTQAAVKKYQIAHGLSAVGTIGPQTRAALNKGL